MIYLIFICLSIFSCLREYFILLISYINSFHHYYIFVRLEQVYKHLFCSIFFNCNLVLSMLNSVNNFFLIIFLLTLARLLLQSVSVSNLKWVCTVLDLCVGKSRAWWKVSQTSLFSLWNHFLVRFIFVIWWRAWKADTYYFARYDGKLLLSITSRPMWYLFTRHVSRTQRRILAASSSADLCWCTAFTLVPVFFSHVAT